MSGARHGRQMALAGFGPTGQQRLADAAVLVVGAGGLGSPVIQYLAAAGVGTLGIADDDVVARHNLHRQIVHTDASVGGPKTASAAAWVAALDPAVRVRRHDVRVDGTNAAEVIAGYDVVVDATDGWAAADALDAACAAAGTPLVWGSALGFDGQLTVFADGGDGIRRRIGDLFPDDGARDDADCAVSGVLGPVCGAIGSAMATETIKLVVGVGEPLVGVLVVHDGRTGGWDEVAYAARAEAPTAATASAPALGVVPDPGGVRVEEVELRLEAGAASLIDVREPWEREVAVIDGSIGVPLGDVLDGSGIAALPAGPLLVHCHHDTRSRIAVDALRAAGRTDIAWVVGGIDAWSRTIDPGIPRY